MSSSRLQALFPAPPKLLFTVGTPPPQPVLPQPFYRRGHFTSLVPVDVLCCRVMTHEWHFIWSLSVQLYKGLRSAPSALPPHPKLTLSLERKTAHLQSYFLFSIPNQFLKSHLLKCALSQTAQAVCVLPNFTQTAACGKHVSHSCHF